MLTKDDLKEIKNLLKPLETGQKKLEIGQNKVAVEQKSLAKELRTNTGSVIKIEKDIKAALELRIDVSDLRTTVKNHEERLSQLETL